jgi:hypothetical protein
MAQRKRSPSGGEEGVSLPWRIAFGVGAPFQHLRLVPRKETSKSNLDLLARKPSHPLPDHLDSDAENTSWSVPSTPSKIPLKCQV